MTQTHKKAFVSWSGGKDSALACYNAIRNNGIEVAYLLNMLTEDGLRSCSHHLSAAVLKTQAQAMGIAIAQRASTWQGYEGEFKKALTCFKKEGIQTGVFGDIDVQEHRDWIERVCGDCGFNAVFPLWQRSRDSLMEEFIAVGFKAVIVVVKPECMGSAWLGRQLDKQFVEDMKRLPQLDLCGENGEYHTLVIDGPIFKRSIKILKNEVVFMPGIDKHWFLDIKEYN